MNFRGTLLCIWAAISVSVGPVWSQEPTASGGLVLGGPVTELRAESAGAPGDLPTSPTHFSVPVLSLTSPSTSAATADPVASTDAPVVLTDDSVARSIPSGRQGFDGFDAFPVMTLTAVQYRSSPGVGVGMASSSAWVISQSFVLHRDLDLTLFYLKSEEETRAGGLDVQAEQLGRTIGVRLSWSY